MKTFVLALIIALPVGSTFAGNCNYSGQTAKDGSSCGDRAADKRPGGR